MNANGTTTATNGASFGRRRLDLDSPTGFASSSVAIALAVATLAVAACSRSGTKDENAPIDPALARAVHRAVQPCIRAHQTLKSPLYMAQLRLERAPSGTATATFRGEKGHEAFEACAVKAIGDAAIPLPQTTTLPAAFDLGPARD
jgi:hypothetical protein